MRLRIARKVVIAHKRAAMRPHPWPVDRRLLNIHREATMSMAYARVYRLHHRHFPESVLHPRSHRQRNHPYAWEGPAPRPEWR